MARPQKKRRRKRWILIIVILALLGGGGHYWREQKKKEKPISVQTEVVKRRDITESVVATGRIHPVTKVVINPEVAGEIVKLPVREGQAVKEGEVLVKIREDNYLASRDLAEANYQSSLASLKLSKANLDKAKADFDRTEGLYNNKLISEAEFQSGKTAWEVAQASYENAEHGVARAEASFDLAKEDLAKTTIVAPIDGTVVQLRSEKGERVVGTSLMAGTEIMTVAQLDQMEARVEVGEVDVVLIKVGQNVRLEADAFRAEEFTGVVSEIANASNTAAMSNAAASMVSSQEATKFQVKVRVNEKAGFRPGMSVTAYIETRSVTDVLSVPLQSVTTRALKGEEDKKSEESSSADEDDEDLKPKKKRDTAKKVDELVFIVESDRVKRQSVEQGISDDDYVEIKSGLEEDQVVVSGSYRAIHRELKDGSLVDVTEAEGGEAEE